MKIRDQIDRTKLEMARTKPRSARRLELELRLHDLIVRQLRAENRAA